MKMMTGWTDGQEEQIGGGQGGLQIKLAFSVWVVFGFVSCFCFSFFRREQNTDDLRRNTCIYFRIPFHLIKSLRVLVHVVFNFNSYTVMRECPLGLLYSLSVSFKKFLCHLFPFCLMSNILNLLLLMSVLCQIER